MPINPLIPLQVRPPDAERSVGGITDSIINIQRGKRRDELLDRKVGIEEQEAQQRAEAAKIRLEREGRLDNARRSLEFNMRALSALKRGDTESVLRMGQGRLRALSEANIDSSDTAAFLQMVQQNPEAAIADATEELKIGERMGLIERAPEENPFTGIGKARRDLERGFITEEQFDALTTPEEKTDFINVPGVGLVKVKGDEASVAIAKPREAAARPAPRGKAAQAIFDQKLVEDQFGADSPQAQAHREMLESESKGEVPKLTDVAGLRKEFTSQSKDFISLRDAIAKVRLAEEESSAAGDVALVFNFMRMLDPGSTVREGEFATAAEAAGLDDRMVQIARKVDTGEILTPDQRKDFVNVAEGIFRSQEAAQKQLEQSFSGIATRQNMNPEDVIVDFKIDGGRGGIDVTVKPVTELTDEELAAEAEKLGIQ